MSFWLLPFVKILLTPEALSSQIKLWCLQPFMFITTMYCSQLTFPVGPRHHHIVGLQQPLSLRAASPILSLLLSTIPVLGSSHPVFELKWGHHLGEPEAWVAIYVRLKTRATLYLYHGEYKALLSWCGYFSLKLYLNSLVTMSIWSKELYVVHQNAWRQSLPI